MIVLRHTRRKGIRTAIAALALGCALCCCAAKVAAEPSTAVADALTRRGDLTLRDSSLEGALFTISELWGINIVSGESPGTVNGVFKNAPLADILDAILLSNGYSYRPVGDSLVISKLADMGQLSPFFTSATIPVIHAEVADVLEGAQMLLTPKGQVRTLPSANSLFVLDFPDRVEMVRDFVKSVDEAAARRHSTTPGAGGQGPRALEVAYMKTHFISAESARAPIEALLGPDGKVAVMAAEDRLLVIDYPEILQVVQAALERLDRPRPQVKIRALIYDISLSDIEQLGLNFGGTQGFGWNGDGEKTSFFRANSVTKVPFAESATGSSFTLASLSHSIDINAVAVALQSAADSRLLADPNITVMENEQASIQSVQEIPYQQLQQTAAGGSIGTTAFKPAGVVLRVTPKIAYDNTIEMQVEPEFSRLTGFTPGDNQPIIDKRVANTTVRVANRQTFVLGGLRQRSDVGDFQGVPGLKDIRYFGHLFRSRKTEIRESELVVFISPEITGYESCPSPRDQFAADAVACRLDRIPHAEGCPTGCVAGCEPGYEPQIGTPAPVEASPPDITPIPEYVEPLPAPQGPELNYPAEARRRAASQGKPLRLPAPDGSTISEQLAPTRDSDMRLRPDFDSRYRSTGGVYASQQRELRGEMPAEKTAEAVKAEEQGGRFWQFWK
ncbi:Type II secretion system protein D precursor [Pirellulimonas nuda]|uniref:Type II secretion system protein D n=1 Tax=Pirellulimonas nuda TaxID=2528009 RepID=A0A518DEL3_9BACT|nr:secretin N-terminal domain-containing protein [Pirellulimonas nuda]QDU89918.1 Type II secretion system protein D precursor [Pirellulimonas nuda]